MKKELREKILGDLSHQVLIMEEEIKELKKENEALKKRLGKVKTLKKTATRET